MTYRKSAHRPLLASVKDALTDMRLSRPLGQLAAAGLGAMAPLAALASPTGGQVVAGSATISNPSANGTLVNQSSQRAVINWQQFSVGANQYVQFVQPDSSAIVLNRVIGGNISNILGDIKANGQVFLINPNGILFGKGATLDVSGLVASTQSISDSDFMAGRYSFTKAAGAPGATVINQGSLSANGGYVVLAGDYVENAGVINAQSGRVLLAAGGGTTLTLSGNQLISYTVDGATLARLAGVSNSGQIAADGGAVVMTGDVADALTATAVNNSGLVTAHSIKSQGGVIELLASGGDLVNSGTLDASATQSGVAGGTVIVRSDKQTNLEPTSVVDAAGDGAKGGLIDLSGHNLSIHGEVTAGKGGSLLLDPSLINIVNGSASSGGTTTNNVGVGFIQSKLNAGSNVTLVATTGIVNASSATRTISAAAAPAASTRFRIATGTVLGGPQCLTAAQGVCVGISSFPSVTVGSGHINLTGLTIITKGQFIASAGQGLVQLDTINANSGIFVTGGVIQVNGNLTAAGGILSIGANRGTTPGAAIKTGPGVTLSGGDVSLHVSGSYGGVISVGSLNGGSVNLGLNYSTLFSPTSPEQILVNGGITAKHIAVSAVGPVASVNINGSITAVNPTGVADVNITANAKGGKASVFVNGSVTVSGKETSISGGTVHPFDLPLVAAMRIEAIGSGTGKHTATVNGNVSVTAVGASYTRSSTCECGPPKRLQTGKGGVAAAYLIATGSLGSASINGNLSVKGPDAHAGLFGNTVLVNGTIAVTGSGHHVTRTVSPETSTASYTSSNSAGQATLQLGAGQAFVGSPAIATAVLGKSVKVAGGITVVGQGVAEVALLGSNVSAGNVSVTATAAKGSLKQKGVTVGACTHFANNDCTDLDSIAFYRGISRTAMHSGSIDAGRADIIVSGGTALGSGSGTPALNVKLGSLTVNGVGRAAVDINAKAITTLGIAVTAAKGTEKGTGSSQSGLSAPITYKHSFAINGGEADVRLHSGGSPSGSSGVLTLNGGPVSVGGNVTISGPAAGLDVKGKTIKLGGAVTVTGSGGSLTSDTLITPPTGPTVHTRFVGTQPTTIHLQGAASGSVSVAGKTILKGPGLVAGIAVAANVTLHGLSGSASATANYSVLDTRVSATADNFTAASIGFITADVTAVGGKPAFAAASDVGAVSLISKGNVLLPAMIKIGGNLTVQASGDIFGNAGSLVTRISAIENDRPRANSHSASGPGTTTLPVFSAKVTSASLTAGGSANLNGVALTAGKGISVTAGTKVLLTSATLFAGSAFTATGATISNGGVAATLTAVGGKFDATSGKIKLGSETLHLGSGPATLSAAGSVDLVGATLGAGGNVTIKGAALAENLAKVSTGGALTETGTNVDLTSATLTATGRLGVHATGSLKLANAVLGGSAVSASAAAISNSGSSANITTTAATGGLKLKSGGAISLNGETLHLAGGNATLSAAGNISLKSAGLLGAGSVHMTAAGSIDLSGITLTSSKTTQLIADKNIVLSGVNITTGTFEATASGTIHNGGATGIITANAMGLEAKQNINLASTQLNIGNGSIASIHGDSTLLLGLAGAKLSPNTPNPNGAFIAGGKLSLGGLKLSGTYLLLQGQAVSLLGPVSVPTGAVVQVVPFDDTSSIGFENSPATGSSFNLANLGFVNLFGAGTTFVLGDSGGTGAVTIGANGPIDIGSDNLIIAGNGSITGLGTVTSTGIVTSLLSLLGPPVPPVTSGEIDPTAGSGTNTGLGDETDKKKLGQPSGSTGGNGQQGGTVSHDDSGTGVCH